MGRALALLAPLLLPPLALLAACSGPELPPAPGEEVLFSFLEHGDRLRGTDPDSELVVRVLAPEGWRAGEEGDERPCFSVRGEGQLRVSLPAAPAEAELVLSAAVRRKHWLGTGSVSLELRTDTGGRAFLELDSSESVPVEERHWRELRLPLEGARAAVLSMSYTGTQAVAPHVLLSDLTLRVPVERPRRPASASRPSIVLIVIDTLRADALGVYGHERATTPVLDGLAARGLHFERAFSAAPWTVPSTASILTGLPPAVHGVDFDSTKDPRGSEFLLAESLTTLAEVLREEGFATAGFSCNPLVSARSNMDQGFDHFRRYGWSQAGEGPVDDALAWLAGRGPERTFLYLHLVDPHAPYRPDEAFLEDYSAPAPDSFAHVEDGSLQDLVWKDEIAEADFRAAVEHAHLLYDGEVASVDAWIGRFLDALEAQGRADRTLVAVTSDHGEEFGEYGAIGHVNQLHDPTLRVPLILVGPGLPAGRSVPFPVENRRLGTTLLSLAGIEARAGFDEPPLLEQESQDGPIFFATRHGRTRIGPRRRWTGYEQLFGVLHAGRLLHWLPATDRREELLALFDLESDPEAREDLAASRPEEARRLRELIEGWLERGDRARRARGARSTASEPDLEALRGLGYLDEE